MKLPIYDEARTFCTETDVGKIEIIHHENGKQCKCMGVCTDIVDTLQHVISCEKLSVDLDLFNADEQKRIFSFLKEGDSELYKNLDSSKRTFFNRDTGDNFQAASHYPTERISFSIQNVS